MHERVEKVKEAIAKLELAWNDRNAYLWSSAFTEKCDYINGNGHFFEAWSREKNAVSHSNGWHSVYSDSHARFEIEKIDFPTDFISIAIVRSYFRVSNSPESKETEYIITVILEKHGLDWLIRNFQNTAVK
jgi:uncharacterized protein (TIGR02246 family)